MIKIGIIGSGFGQYGLLPAFRSIKQCQVAALAGRKRPQLVEFCKSIGFTNIYSDWRKLLEHEELDAVALAVTPFAQYEIAKVAIAKGLHVFAEKPLAVNVAQAEELLALAKKKKITHGIDFIFPEIAAWKKVKKLLDNKTYGKLRYISVNWDFLSYDIKNRHSSWKTSEALGGGVVSFFFSHGLYYLEYFVGPITNIRSLLTQSKDSINGGEVGADLLLKFEGGITGYAHVYANSHGLTRHQLIFYCERAVLVLENKKHVVDNFTVKKYSQKSSRYLRVKKDTGFKNEDERVKIVRKLAARFISCCLSRSQMYPSFKEGLRVQELIELARTSAFK